jgi:hypothetical protein
VLIPSRMARTSLLRAVAENGHEHHHYHRCCQQLHPSSVVTHMLSGLDTRNYQSALSTLMQPGTFKSQPHPGLIDRSVAPIILCDASCCCTESYLPWYLLLRYSVPITNLASRTQSTTAISQSYRPITIPRGDRCSRFCLGGIR